MTKLSVKDHNGEIHEFDHPVSIKVGPHGELLVFDGEAPMPGETPKAGFSHDWYFEWGVRDAKPTKSRGAKPASSKV